MEPMPIEGETRRLGESQGYLGLPIRNDIVECTVGGAGTPCMLSAWMPSDEERAAISAGAPIILRVIGTAHPPVMIETGRIVE